MRTLSLHGAGTLPAPSRNLRTDTRGAIMFIALFMACMLIGALWSLIGIGDAVVARDLAQEATDSAGASASVIQAKGMNVIAFLNCVILGVTFVWLVVCLIVDVMLLITGLAISSVVGVFVVPELITTVYEIDRNIAGPLKEGMVQAMPVIAGVQTAVAAISAYAGAIAGIQVALADYKMPVITLPVSAIPGSDVNDLLTTMPSFSGSIGLPSIGTSPSHAAVSKKKIGLPVDGMPMNFACNVGVSMVFDKVTELVNGIPLFGMFAQPVTSFIKPMLTSTASSAVTTMHCNDGNTSFDATAMNERKQKDCGFGDVVCSTMKSILNAALVPIRWMLQLVTANGNVYRAHDFWSAKKGGPKEIDALAANGNALLDTVSAHATILQDAQAHGVQIAMALGKKKTEKAKSTEPNRAVYTGQSSFHCECKSKGEATQWSNECNGQGPDGKGGSFYGFAGYKTCWQAGIEKVGLDFAKGKGKAIGASIKKIFGGSSMVGWVLKRATPFIKGPNVAGFDLAFIVKTLFDDAEGTQSACEDFISSAEHAVQVGQGVFDSAKDTVDSAGGSGGLIDKGKGTYEKGKDAYEKGKGAWSTGEKFLRHGKGCLGLK
jgi:hypothetical protein